MFIKEKKKGITLKSFIGALLLLIFLSPVSAVSSPSQPIRVLCTFSILGDLVKQVGQDLIQVTSIVGPNSDTHVFEPTPKDLQNLTQADLIFMNGLFFEGWMDRLIDPSEIGHRVIIVSQAIKPRKHDHHNCAHLSAAHALDPHAWHSIPNALLYIQEIERALSKKYPEHRDSFRANAAHYKAKLLALHKRLRAAFSEIPKNRRIAVTTHDGFGYLGDTYGIHFLSPLGLSTEGEASAKSLAQVIEAIKNSKVSLVFVENITSHRLMQQVCEETKTRLGPVLYSDALSEATGPASNYLEMMQHNADNLLNSMVP